MRILLTLKFLAISMAVFSQQQYYPNATWETRTAISLGINAKLLDSAVQFALNNENKVERNLRIANLKSYAREPDYKILGPMKQRGGPAGLIIKNGYIAAQWGDVQRVDMTFSVTKSYLSVVAGLAKDAGLIRSEKDSVSQYVTETYFEGKHNAAVTWQHLLTQSSDWSGSLFGLNDWADRPPKDGEIDDWKNRKLLPAGSNFEYNDVRVNLLAYALLQVWRKPLPMVLKEKIMDPIGSSTTWRWHGYDNAFVNVDGIMMQSVSGGGHHGGGIFINTLDQARLGLLFLRNGKWNNQQLLSKSWIDETRKPSTANKNYGYLWWLNTDGGWKGISPDVYYAAGYGGNYIIIVPDQDIVLVTRWMDDAKIAELVSKVISAVK
jgi:CubicO group peptidase (beta-lactamase class C family)